MGFINAGAKANADVFDKAKELLDALANWDTLQDWLGVFPGPVKTFGEKGLKAAAYEFGASSATEPVTETPLIEDYGDFIEKAGAVLLQSVKNLDGELQNGKSGIVYKPGVRIDIFFEWEECTCRNWTFWNTFAWVEGKKYVFNCQLRQDGTVENSKDPEYSTQPKTLSSLTNKDIAACMKAAHEDFKKTIIDK